jgi:hypothetical protein
MAPHLNRPVIFLRKQVLDDRKTSKMKAQLFFRRDQ